jgi:trk system potassium uptake protein TrkA
MNVMIIGGGKVGEYLADFLLKSGHRVKLIEEQRQNYTQLLTTFSKDVVVLGNGTDPDVLEANDIRNMNVVAAVTGIDETNLVVTSLARFEFEVPRIIARVNHPKNAWMFTAEMGVDVALNQADLIASMIAEEMSLGDMMLLHKLRKGQFSLVEEKVAPESAANGKLVRDLKLPPECIFAAILRKGEMIVPRGDVVLQAYDEVIAVVHSSKLQALAKILGDGI